MNTGINSIIREMDEVIHGRPWFGRSVMPILEEVNTNLVYSKPTQGSHSLIELLYHMNTWALFTLERIEKKSMDPAVFDAMDWREIDPEKHKWEDALAEFRNIHLQIINALQSKNDAFLEETVDYRGYNFRFLLNGLVQHNIYHLGQLAYLKNQLKEM